MATVPEPSVLSFGAMSHDRASVLPAALAALGESGVIWILASSLAGDSSGITGGWLVSFPQFLVVFVLAVTMGTALRRHAATPVVISAMAIGGGVAEGVWGGAGTASAVIAGVLISLGVAVRVVSLAVRDWRTPVSSSFGLGAVVLLAEMSVAAPPRARDLLPTIVVLFFVGSMASRASSVWLANRPPPGSHLEPIPRRFRNPAVLVAVLGAILGATFLLSAPGGAFQLSGGVVYAAFAQVLALVGLGLARVIIPPLGWFVEAFHISFQPVRDVAESLAKVKGVNNDPSGRTFAVERLLGLLFLVTLAFLLVRSVRRRWKTLEPEPEEEAEPPAPVPSRMVLPRRGKSRRRGVHRELPADTVRRWYAEALLALERLGLPKPPSRTPGEYLREVTAEYPSCAIGFTALTRAYEDVRYGSLAVQGDDLDRLEVHRELAMTALRSARPVEREPGSS
jgi:Domain of unknown function (DUF4129)